MTLKYELDDHEYLLSQDPAYQEWLALLDAIDEKQEQMEERLNADRHR